MPTLFQNEVLADREIAILNRFTLHMDWQQLFLWSKNEFPFSAELQRNKNMSWNWNTVKSSEWIVVIVEETAS